MAALLVGLAGGVGASTRYAVEAGVTGRVGSRWPWGTGIVNVLASVILGLVTGLVTERSGSDLGLVVGTGFCGGFSTWSAVTWEVLVLGRRSTTRAVVYAVVAPASSIAAAALGLAVGRL
jgi:CrcB protein